MNSQLVISLCTVSEPDSFTRVFRLLLARDGKAFLQRTLSATAMDSEDRDTLYRSNRLSFTPKDLTPLASIYRLHLKETERKVYSIRKERLLRANINMEMQPLPTG